MSAAFALAPLINFTLAHVRLMEQMAARVDQVTAGRLSPEMEIDGPGLAREHRQRTQSLDSALKIVVETNWQRTERAIHEILSERDGV